MHYLVSIGRSSVVHSLKKNIEQGSKVAGMGHITRDALKLLLNPADEPNGNVTFEPIIIRLYSTLFKVELDC